MLYTPLVKVRKALKGKPLVQQPLIDWLGHTMWSLVTLFDLIWTRSISAYGVNAGLDTLPPSDLVATRVP